MRKLAILLAGVAAVLAAVSPGAVPAVSDALAGPTASSHPVLQMNLCLSGQAGCYDSSDYRAVLAEATAQIADEDPDAVTLNEACSRDAAAIAQRTGYRLRFAPVDYGGTELPCIDPRGRGVFGIAVLTRDDITASRDRAFAVQADPEERRWLCATTDRAVTVCTAHLSTRSSTREREANDAECRELRSVLAGYQRAGTTLFGGDLNRQSPCAPSTMWSTRDTAATQSPGVQHIYGSTPVDGTAGAVDEATYTDHDFLLAVATTAPGR